jgi:hypothetical protein
VRLFLIIVTSHHRLATGLEILVLLSEVHLCFGKEGARTGPVSGRRHDQVRSKTR